MRQMPAGLEWACAACRWLAGLAVALIVLAGGPEAAIALQPVVIGPDQDRIEITRLGDFYEGRGDRLHIETAPGADGIAGRMVVKAATAGTNPNWFLFALRNPSDRPIERWLTADRYTIVGSGLIWPDLDTRRIESVTPSLGLVPDRIRNDRADIFRLTVEPGQTITFVAELASERMPGLYLWSALAYEQRQRDRSLFNGILIGIVGLLAIFLTAIFAANHKAIFPTAALVAWCVLGYLCIDFGFWHKLFQLKSDENAVYRAAAEGAAVTSIVLFLYAFLRIGLWNGFMRMLFAVWIIGQGAIVAIAIIDPRLAAMLARASLVPSAALGSLLIMYLAMRGQDRALALVPTWLLLLVWIFGAGVTVTGRLSGDIVVSGLVSGLVLIVVLLGFTVTQFAFRAGDPLFGAPTGSLQTRSLAIDGAGVAVWEWNARREEMSVSAGLETALGLQEGDLSRRVDDFVARLHPQDRDRFHQMLWTVREKGGGHLQQEFRLRKADGTYRWFELEASSIPHADHKSLKCAGLLRDVTEVKRSQERLVHDAVHDSLTGLPNRELFLDRVQTALNQVRHEGYGHPVLLFIGIDRFKSVNSAFGFIVGDSMLLTVARRLARHLGPQDTLARIGGDQFAILITKPHSPAEVHMFAERMRRTLRTPMKISGQDIILTGSLGIAGYDGTQATPQDLLREAESAMFKAKQGGTDRVEVFKPEMRSDRDDRTAIETELRRAVERRQLYLVYQPIMRLPQEEVAGFEALLRWDHPKLGPLSPDEFVPLAEESDLITKLGSFALEQAVADAGRWQKELPRDKDPLFVSVNVSSRQLFRQDLVAEIRRIVGRQDIVHGSLQLEVTESLVMENAEQAAEILGWIKGSGARVALDDFGAGFSSFGYLHKFPFDTIKIDKSLVRSRPGDESGHAIVRSLVALGHELGKTLVAEGVETVETASFLRSVGCDLAQGFFYGEPMRDGDVLELLRLIRKSERGSERRWLKAWRERERRAAEPVDAHAPNGAPPAAAPRPHMQRPPSPPPAAPMPPAPMPTPATTAPSPPSPPAPPPPPATLGRPAPIPAAAPPMVTPPITARPSGAPPPPTPAAAMASVSSALAALVQPPPDAVAGPTADPAKVLPPLPTGTSRS